MSRPTHHGDPTRTCITTPLSNNIRNNRLEEAKKAFCFLTISERSKPQHLDELWQQLRRSYEAVNTDDGQPFPYWALENLPLDKIAALIRMAYVEDLGALQMHASRMPPYFNTDAWKSVLFFDYIEHGRGRVLRKIYKKRPTITLEQMYEEVRRNQLNRLSAPNVLNWRPRNPRAYFHISDYKGCLHGGNDEDGIDEEIEDESEAEMIETGDEDNENIDQQPRFQLIDEDISIGHQEGDNIDGCDFENSHDQGGRLTDNLVGTSTRDEEYSIISDDVDDTSASSPKANLPTQGTNSPIATLDDLEPQTLGGPTREANAMDDGSLTITDPLQDEARRQDVDQTPPSSPDILSTVRSFVDSQKSRRDHAAKQLKNEQKRFEDAELILAGLATLDERDAASKSNIQGFISEDAKAQAECNNFLRGLATNRNISVEDRISKATSKATSFILDSEERLTKRQAEESEMAENRNKRTKLKADFKELQAPAANREPSLPIRSLESF